MIFDSGLSRPSHAFLSLFPTPYSEARDTAVNQTKYAALLCVGTAAEQQSVMPASSAVSKTTAVSGRSPSSAGWTSKQEHRHEHDHGHGHEHGHEQGPPHPDPPTPISLTNTPANHGKPPSHFLPFPLSLSRLSENIPTQTSLFLAYSWRLHPLASPRTRWRMRGQGWR